MHIFKKLQKKIEEVIFNKFENAISITAPKVVVELIKDDFLGEITTNAAMVFSKYLKVSPKELAKILCTDIEKFEEVFKIEIAGPGFINLTLHKHVWVEELISLVLSGEKYSEIKLSQGEQVNIEFVSANPTGPMHAGHVRNAVLGDILCLILSKVGYNIHKEYYINDAGNQVNILARSVYMRYLEILGEKINSESFATGLYPGEYLIPVAQKIADLHGNKWQNLPEEKWLPLFKRFAIDSMMEIIKQDLISLGIKMDRYSSEEEITLSGKIEEALKLFEKANVLYRGTLPKPKNMEDKEWEERPQLLFRSSDYGDNEDRAIQKSDNSWTYFAGDIAYHLNKYQRGFTKMINVLGADHCGYTARIKAAVTVLSQGKASLDIKLFQMVNFFENGKQLKMSKRAGTFITAKDIVGRVGKDATRFMMVSKHNDTVIDFDFQKVLEQTHENPLFYIQYAHARICSVFRNVIEFFNINEDSIKEISSNNLKHLIFEDVEIRVIRHLTFWPKIVEQAAIALEPHRIATYLYSIAGEFHRLWNLGKTSLHLRFIDKENRKNTEAKLFLLNGVATVIRDGLKLLGIEPVNEMR